MLMKRFFYFAAAMLTALAVSCSKDEKDSPNGGTQESDVFVITSDKTFTVEASGASYTVTFTSTAPWTAVSNNESVATVSPSSGKAGENTVTVTVLPNKDNEEKEADIKIACGTYAADIVKVTQAAYFQGKKLSIESITYLGTRQYIYDADNYAYSDDVFGEYYIKASTADGDVVTLSVNAVPQEDPTASVPDGTYSVDASAKHPAETFTIKDSEGKVEYYTSVTVNGSESAVEDGEIVISSSKVGRNIAATLVCADEEVQYFFSGDFPEISSDSFGVEGGAFDQKDYYTHFTSKANQWNITLRLSEPLEGDDLGVRSINFTIYAAENAGINELPVGDLVYTSQEEKEGLDYASGTVDVNPGEFAFSSYLGVLNIKDEYGNFYSVTTDTAEDAVEQKLKVTKTGENTYTFDFQVPASFDYNGNTYRTVLKGTAENIYLPVTGEGSAGSDDGSAVFNTVMSPQYIGLWFGQPFLDEENPANSNPNNVIIAGFSQVNWLYEIYLAITPESSWEYTQNFSRYCNTPFITGTCSFDATAKAQKAIIPVKYNGNIYCYVKNTYTGTICPISGGSITEENGTVNFNLEAVNPKTKEKYTYTGGFASKLYYIRNNSAQASKITLYDPNAI